MYENATAKDAGNEELLSQLFMSYVRVGFYKKQQQTALQLYKVKPKNPYYFWAVMSVVLQAITCQVGVSAGRAILKQPNSFSCCREASRPG